MLGVLYGLEVRGAEHVLPGPLIVVANHESVLDPLVLGVAVPRTLRFLAKEELWRLPLLARRLDDLGGIPVARGRGDRAAIEAAAAALARGEAVAMFPAGGVRREGRWLRGAARLALLTGTPLLPVRLLGTAGALRRGHVGFPRLAALIGEPLRVAPQAPTIAAARTLTERMQRAVAGLGS